jgi:hypothetical protein
MRVLSRSTSALCTAVLLLSSARGLAQGEVVDRVAAVVEGALITQSDLEFEARVLLIERGGAEAAYAPLDEDALRGALDVGIAQRLQIAEADRLSAYPLDEQQLLARVQRFEQRLGGRGPLAKFLASQDRDLSQLEEVLGRGQRAEKVLDGKVRLRAQVSDADVQAELLRHPELKGAPDTDRSRIREQLARERYQKLAQAELTSLRAAANVRLVAPWAKVHVRVSP